MARPPYFSKECVGPLQVLLAQEKRVLPLEHRRPNLGANPVIQGVSDHRRDKQQHRHQVDV
jgi:hypothetical protein